MQKFTLFFMCIILSATVTLNAQDFGRKGLWELGGLVMYANNNIVVDGESQDESLNFFFVNVPVYYMPVDGWQIGIVPEFVSVGLGGDIDATLSVFGGFFSTAYVFKTGGSVYPFIEGRVGYNSVNVSVGSVPDLELEKTTGIQQDEVDETLSGIGWGFSGGIKVQIARGALINFGVGYQQRTANPEDWDGGRVGLDVITVQAGFAVFLGK
jgi:hypothetical protein